MTRFRQMRRSAGFAICAVTLAGTLAQTASAALSDHQPYTVEADANGFVIDGEYKLLRGGSLQWFRLPPESWPDRLAKFKAAGFNTIDLYVPWNVIEPRENEFTFSSPDLGAFLSLAQSYGLYVYFRPGPYITNEMDGGGVPGWLMTKTTKKSTRADGQVNLRTDDPDYLFYVRRYLHRLNQFIKPWLASEGGPIILYSLENEYNWFELFHEVDKLFWYEGGPERALLAKVPTASYFRALRDQVRSDGIDVPLTTCPGDGKASATGDVSGIIPMPNVYNGLGGEAPEKVAWDLLSDMHDPAKHRGAYTNYPTGTTETDREPARIKRMLMGGMDATFAFNVVGMHQEGYLNSVVLDINGDTFNKVFDFSKLENILTGYLSPTVGYFHNVIDYNGAISPSGLLRDKFFEFRRDNLALDAIEPWLAPSGKARRNDPHLQIANDALGAPEGNERVHYWQDAGNGTGFINLVNGSGTPQTISRHGITLNEIRFPNYVEMTVPILNTAGPGQFGDTDTTSATILPVRLPLQGIGTLNYSTSELLALRAFNGETLLMVHGLAGSQGELQIDFDGKPYRIVHGQEGFGVHPEAGGELTLTYTHDAPRELVVEQPNGEILRIVSLESKLAGRTWFVDSEGESLVVIGPELVDETRLDLNRNGLQIPAFTDHTTPELWLLGARPVQLNAPWNAMTEPTSSGLPTLRKYQRALQARWYQPDPDLLNRGFIREDRAESLPGFDSPDMPHWQGKPTSLESHQIIRGHAWYRAELNLSGWNWLPFWEPTDLWIEHASDIVGIYVNGTYLSTLSPLGTEIDGNLANPTYQLPDLRPYLHKGKNVIAFRTEIWGHGSFMFPRGKLDGTAAQIPSVGFDSEKGLFGNAKVGWRTLDNWSVIGGLGGERADYATQPIGTGWQASTAPSQLQKGSVLWYRTEFDRTDLPDSEEVVAPVSLELKGRNTKATIYLNGRLIGRWISDDNWLSRGFWGRAKRDMWMNTDPDHFPIAREMLKPAGQPNQLAIVFEDTSGHRDQTGGTIDHIRLVLSKENHQEARPLYPLDIRGEWN